MADETQDFHISFDGTVPVSEFRYVTEVYWKMYPDHDTGMARIDPRTIAFNRRTNRLEGTVYVSRKYWNECQDVYKHRQAMSAAKGPGDSKYFGVLQELYMKAEVPDDQ